MELPSTEKGKTVVEQLLGKNKNQQEFSYCLLDLGHLLDIQLEIIG